MHIPDDAAKQSSSEPLALSSDPINKGRDIFDDQMSKLFARLDARIACSSTSSLSDICEFHRGESFDEQMNKVFAHQSPDKPEEVLVT